MITTLNYIKENNIEVYNTLLQCECKVTYNGRVIYEGQYDENYEYPKKYDKSKIVIEFNINEHKGIFLLEENQAIKEYEALLKEHSFEEICNTPSLYNKSMNLANKLPIYLLEMNKEEVTKRYGKMSGNMNILFENYILLEADDEENDESDDDTSDNKSKSEDDAKKIERGEIKFTIWEAPDKKITWLENGQKYQKIEYVYENKELNITIDFLLGQEDGIWKLWCGKVGATTYDDDPYCSFDTEDFAHGVVDCLDKVQEIIQDVKDNPDNWVQFYIHI